jgi:hypothetical protein
MLQLHIEYYIPPSMIRLLLPSNRKLNIISAFFKDCAGTHSLLAGEFENGPCLLLKSNKKKAC